MILLAIFSFLPVFSSSSNLAYAGQGTGNTLSFLAKHFVHISVGIFIMYQIQRIPHQYWRSLSYILLIISWVLLLYTLFKGQIIAGANASRWLMVPVIGVSFQPSTIAFMLLMIHVSRYLAKHINE
ncbi:FtsW/RodA/SpoVE family cell cycle protein, partial [Arthrospira platensis SPKY1]|nr:FtsW/RodA/SpoVE family cell cycle protein [Arthrospira platensis SPKY1]